MLKVLFTCVLAASVLGSVALGQDYHARIRVNGWPEIFRPGYLLDLNLSMSQANWNTVQGDTSFSVEVPAMFWLGNDVPILVAVRRKSCDALNSASGFSKVSLKIDINEYVAGQEWYDLKKLSLENGDDEDVVTEGMAWELHRMGTGPVGYDYVTGLANWATIKINGVSTGLYVNVEQRDKTFLKNRGTWVGGSTWLYHLDDVYSDSLNSGTGDSPEYQTLCYEPFQNPNMGCSVPSLGDFQAELEALVDMKGMLTVAAVNAFMGHRDSLFSKGKNTMFADFSTGRKREYYPWDLDSVLTQQNHNIFNPGKHYADSIYAVPAFRAQFKQILGDLLAGPMHPNEMHAFLEAMEPILTPWLVQDPNNKIGNAQDIAQHFQQKKDWVTDRAVIVLDQIAND